MVDALRLSTLQECAPLIFRILAQSPIGAVAGWLAGVILEGGGFGLLVNIVVGILGAIVGGFAFGLLGISAGGILGAIITATVGAVLLLFIVGFVKKTA
jgi:uncharacterized membrane protein YeaQ/YmgE (transglycosylase-associated protein family)